MKYPVQIVMGAQRAGGYSYGRIFRTHVESKISQLQDSRTDNHDTNLPKRNQDRFLC